MSMTLEETIARYEKIAIENHSGLAYALKRGEAKYAERCKKSMDEFRQLAEWLKELVERRKLESIQQKYEPVTAEDFAKTMSETSTYSYMAWYSEALSLMKRTGFVICKKKT